MTFGILQDAYAHHLTSLHGPKSATGVIGTTMNGVLYLSIPVLSTALDTVRWAPYRRVVAIAGVLIQSASFFASAWSTEMWHLILLQGVTAAVGAAMTFSPLTLTIDEWFRNGIRSYS